jgi:hypothetical protein
MKRRLFNILPALPLLLCVATCVLWVCSYWVAAAIFKDTGPGSQGGPGEGVAGDHTPANTLTPAFQGQNGQSPTPRRSSGASAGRGRMCRVAATVV